MASLSSVKGCLYEVLNLSPGCSADEIRLSYKKLALQRHPDKLVQSGESQAKATADFQELANAYNVLSDLRQRSMYDYCRTRINLPQHPKSTTNNPGSTTTTSNPQSSGPTNAPVPPVKKTWADLFKEKKKPSDSSSSKKFTEDKNGFIPESTAVNSVSPDFIPYFEVNDEFSLFAFSPCAYEPYFVYLGSFTDNVRHTGHADSESSFYKVYAKLFKKIWDNELKFGKNPLLPPIFGDLESAYIQVRAFYEHWLGFETSMEINPAVRNDYGEMVRRIVKFVNNNDKRVIDMKTMTEANKELKKHKERQIGREKLDRQRLEQSKELEKEFAKAEAAKKYEEELLKAEQARKYEECAKKAYEEEQAKNNYKAQPKAGDKEYVVDEEEVKCVLCGTKFRYHEKLHIWCSDLEDLFFRRS